MHISIDTTEPISDLDLTILGVLIQNDATQAAPAPEPQAKPAAKKAVAKKAAVPVPEPMAEEPVEDEPIEEDVDAEEQSDEDLLTLAVKKATEMVAGGDAAKVREALDAAGASRVRELNKDNVREFFRALS